MIKENNTVTWTTFVFSEEEFKRLLGITDPRHILSVSIDSRNSLISVTMMSK